MKPQLLTTEQAAAYLGGLKPNSIEGWRVQGKGPRYVKIGRLVRYNQQDLDAYIAQQTRNSTSEVSAIRTLTAGGAK